MVMGIKVDFEVGPSSALSAPNPFFRSKDDEKEVEKFVGELQNLSIIREVNYAEDLVVNPVFVARNGSSARLILNSKLVNQNCIKLKHFKMETLKSVLANLEEGDWFISIDIRKGFHNLALHPDHQKFFAFKWRSKFYVFQALPMGLREAPRLFTVIMKSLLTVLRLLGVRVFIYIDDSLLAARNPEDAHAQGIALKNLLENAGFTVHPEKSVLIPTQRMKFLGFWIDTTEMVVELPQEKFLQLKKNLRWLKNHIRLRREIKLRKFAQIIGFLLSCVPAVPYGEVHYRDFEFFKTRALRSGGWEQMVIVPKELLKELNWWEEKSPPLQRSFREKSISHKIYTDASSGGGWGLLAFGEKQKKIV